MFDDRGPELIVPYLYETAADPEPHQFGRPNRWFNLRDEALPKTLLFTDNLGWVTASGSRISGSSIGVRSQGKVRAQAWIFNRPREIRDRYLVNQFSSTIDGLEEFARFEPVRFDVTQTEGGHRVELTVDAAENLRWAVDGFQYEIHANAAWTGQDGRRFEITDARPNLSTVVDGGATIPDHYEAQLPIRALLILVFGHKLSWRSHRLRDDDFPMWMADGSDRGAHGVEVVLSSTVKQHGQPKLTSQDLAFPAFHLQDLGAAGLERWIALYGSTDFRRAVEPAVEVLNGATNFLEPQLMMLAISLDRFGYFRFADGRRRAMHEHILKCITDAGLDWPDVGSQVGIAKAISNMNNDLKHPDRPTYPDMNRLSCIVELAEILARAQLFDLLGLPQGLAQGFLSSAGAGAARRAFAAANLHVTDEGVLESL
ncbi:MAG: hypothetical protein KF727_13400 [Microbacteriaceae bacterium]|nr:hypothetical protein [Microbacteriaceae bacterium]